MNLDEFIAFHGPALEADPARHNLILGQLERARGNPEHGVMLWTLGRPGACAIKTRPAFRGIILGAPTREEAYLLGAETAGADYPTVQGECGPVEAFVAGAQAHGLAFEQAEALRIHALEHAPRRPDVPGAARAMTADDTPLMWEWWLAFNRDAHIADPRPTREEAAGKAAGGTMWLWTVDGAPVAMAGIGRRIRDCASIGPVFTPREHRGRGFAGAVTAHVADVIFAEGRRIACLYTDLANPVSNRCYARLGFTPVCDGRVFRRLPAEAAPPPAVTAG